MGNALGFESLRRIAKANGSTSWTYSAWINIVDTKQVDGNSDYVFSWKGTNDQDNGFAISRSSDQLVYLWNGSASVSRKIRDGNGFYHLVVSCNNGSATAYINGSSVLSGVSYTPISGGNPIVVGDWINGGNKLNGSMFDVYFVDGQALSPSVFAEDKAYRASQWGPKLPNTVKAAIGSFGTNGFYLSMQEDSSYIGNFSDGNSKSWTIGGNPRYIKRGALNGLTEPGDTAIHLDSTKATDYFRLNDGDLDLNGKAWTVEFFIARGESWNSGKGVISLDTTGVSTYESLLFYSTSSGLVLYSSSTGNTWDIFSDSGVISTMTPYRNYHIALTRDTGGTIRLYVNGTQIRSSSGNVVSGRTMLTLGSRGSISGVGDLFISGWRIIKDTALYTGSSFTVPTTLDNSVNGTVTHYGGTNSINSIGEDTSGNNYHLVTDNFEHNHLTDHSMYNQFCQWVDESGFDGTVGDGGTMTTTNDMLGSIGLWEGKWYWEFTANDMFTGGGGGGNVHHFGVIAGNSNEEINSGVYLSSGKVVRRADAQDQLSEGDGISNGSASGTLANFADGSIIGLALDLDSTPCTLKYYENNVLQYTQSFNYDFYGYNYLIPFARSNGLEGYYNFGQGTWVTSNGKNGYADENGYGRFQYAPPAGYKAICTENLNYPAASLDPGDHFKMISYTGTGGSQSITGAGFKPSFAWIKVYNIGYSGAWFDRHRGADNMLWPDAYNVSTGYSNELTSFDSDGFTTGGNLHTGTTNRPYTAYLWKGPETASTNNVGSTTSYTYADDEGGFSTVRWSGDGGSSVGTGLSGKSCFSIVGRYNSGGISNWWVYFGEDDWGRARMDLSEGGFIDGSNGILHSTPGQLVFNAPDFNVSGGQFFAYTWKTVPGFIKCGRYVSSTNEAGPYVHTGFRPQFLLVKRMNGNGSWQLVDEQNNVTNPTSTNYTLDTGVVSSFTGVDFLTTGFKVRQNGGAFNGYDNNTYAYFAIGKAPLGLATPR